ncbi:hypothetical protein [Virgibacillus litoralis]|uniref:ABC transporter permease n=1 Tax=Virgibacillus litoralis TaxID=578221 RepID=A0ABS4HB36_9BACI|nr:hypothetical protein [Virgibacillus litoralis]MBP1948117.1 hypothetical protein [Virgibacillus litoralis]
MGRQLKGLLYFFITDIRYSLLIFWTILLSILVVSLAFAYFLTDVENGMMILSLTGPMYVYCGILGFLTVKESIPFSIKMGATRKSVFVSLGIFFLAISLFMSTAASILQEIVKVLAEMTGVDTFSFLHLAYFVDNTWYTRILIDTSVMFFFLALMFVVGLIFFRYGLAGGGSFLGVLVVLLLISIAKGWIVDFFINLFSEIDLAFFYQMLGLGIVVYCISFLFLRRITTVKVK